MKEIVFKPETSMVERLKAFWRWVRLGYCKIKDRRGRLVALVPNRLQERIYRQILEEAMRGVPIRMIVLKMRKGGVSTIVQALFFFLCQHTPQTSARTIAHTQPSTDDIFRISQRIAANLSEGQKPSCSTGACVTFSHDSQLDVRTAGGIFPSSSATIELLHLSEVAKWDGTEESVRAQLASTLNSVPYAAHTIVVLESTANQLDKSGQFQRQWLSARRGQAGYVAVFSPWFEEETYRISGALDLRDEYEQWLVEQFKLTDDQLLWRRQKIAGDYGGQANWFAQDYPATEDEAFQAPSGLIFPMLKESVHVWHASPPELELFRCYRAIDFGGADPFVCLWIGHRPGRPRLTIDRVACPNMWRELTNYAYGENKRPRDVNDHTCDALRYGVTYFGMTGHVHVYREMYEVDSARRGMSLLDLAQIVLGQSQQEIIYGTVADRSQPGSINLLNQQGLLSAPYEPPQRASGYGEKVDGIVVLQILALATLPMSYPPPERCWEERVIERQRSARLPLGIASQDMIVALNRYSTDKGRDLNPLFGAYM